jgi:alkylation response protein AidB-like acyl-CoA dehydrogenase
MAVPAGRALGDAMWPDVTRFIPADLLTALGKAAPGADEAGEVGDGSLTALREAGFPGLPVPEQFGGAGASLRECCAVQRLIATADPGLAVGVNMHLFSVGLMVEHWRRRTDVSWLLLEAIATQNRLLASAFAEPNLAGSVVRSTLRAAPAPDGWRISGVKSPCSLVIDADLVCLQVQTDPAEGPEELLVALLPTTAPGLSVQRTWDTLGMRGSASHTLRLTDCFIPEKLVFYRSPVGGEDDDVVAAGLVWFCLTTTSVYLGLAQAALDSACDVMGRTRVAHLDAARAELPSFQGELGDQVGPLLTLAAGVLAVAAAMDSGDDPERLLPTALALKQHSIAVIPRAVAALAESCGGQAYARSLRLERVWRDAQAIHFHPPTRFASRQYLGRLALGLSAQLDLDEAAAHRTSAE